MTPQVDAPAATPSTAALLVEARESLAKVARTQDIAKVIRLLDEVDGHLGSACWHASPTNGIVVLIGAIRSRLAGAAAALKTRRNRRIPLPEELTDIQGSLEGVIKLARAESKAAPVAARKPPWPRSMESTPTVVCHPASTVQLAAAALETDARQLRAAGDKTGAAYAVRAAKALRRVADGDDWVAAFGWNRTRED